GPASRAGFALGPASRGGFALAALLARAALAGPAVLGGRALAGGLGCGRRCALALGGLDALLGGVLRLGALGREVRLAHLRGLADDDGCLLDDVARHLAGRRDLRHTDCLAAGQL